MHNISKTFASSIQKSFGTDDIPYYASHLWQQMPIDVCEAVSLVLFKNHIKTWKLGIRTCKRAKDLCKMSSISGLGPLVTDGNISVN